MSGGLRGQQQSYRGRGGHRGPHPARIPTIYELPTSLGPVVSTISLQEMSASLVKETGNQDHKPKISGCTTLASYNLTSNEITTILIPGAPPLWTPLANPVELKQDRGTYVRDENAARFPVYPMEPTVQAILDTDTTFRGSSIDIVSCGTTLSHLAALLTTSYEPKDHKPFSIVVQMIGSTAFFLRREKVPIDLIENAHGHGIAFPVAYTSLEEDVKGSVSHQRVIQYQFGSRQLVVRYEADGYLGDYSFKPNASGKAADFRKRLHPAMEEWSKKHVTTRQAGRNVEHQKLFDLKTRGASKSNHDILGGEMARLWVRQTAYFVLAFHKRGVFDDIRVKNIAGAVQAWEAGKQQELSRLQVLIAKILAAANQAEGRTIEVRCPEATLIEFCSVKSSIKALPEGLWKRWEGASVKDNQTKHAEMSSEDSVEERASRPDDSGDKGKESTACSAWDCGYCGHCT